MKRFSIHKKQTKMLIIPLLFAVLFTIVHIFFGHSWMNTSGHAWGSDDAYISFRYALNAVTGYGLVFNLGDQVEGYSNLLFVLLLMPIALLGSEALYPASLIINTTALAGLVLVVGFWLQRYSGQLAALVGSMGIATFPPFWLAVASGLETPLVVLLQVIVVIGTISIVGRPKPWLYTSITVASGLLVFLRPDGFIVPVLATVLLLAAGMRAVAWRLILALAVTLAAATTWRLAYYGLPLPMTYYVKVTGSLGERLRAALVQLTSEGFSWGVVPHLGIILVLGLVLAATLLRSKQLPITLSAQGILGYFGCVWLAYWFYIGGDVFNERFLLLVVVLSWISVALLAQRMRAATLLVASVGVLQMSPLLLDGRFQYASKPYDMWIETGRFLGAHHPGRLLAIDAAGKVPFFSNLRTIDMLGLNDAHIGMKPASFTVVGHSKTDPHYVLSRRPDLIAAWIANGELDLAWGLNKSLYQAQGYCLRYLVHSGRHPGGNPILDLRDGRQHDVKRLVQDGYNYAVLQHQRVSPCAAS